ncbi:MAG: SCP2 sterol-binding domain-containing protein [Acidimicrobiales bacterium]
MTRYPFLSEEWIQQTRLIREEFKDRAPAVMMSVRMNQIISDVPFGVGVVHAHLDTSSGVLDIETGHVESPDVTVTMPYDVARALLVDGDASAAMNAFMSGRIKVDGDITKLLGLQVPASSAAASPEAALVVERIKSITE